MRKNFGFIAFGATLVMLPMTYALFTERAQKIEAREQTVKVLKAYNESLACEEALRQAIEILEEQRRIRKIELEMQCEECL